jgi:stage V sporulation protein AD
MTRTRTRTLPSPPFIVGSGSVAGPMEGRGPMGKWFGAVVSDDTMGEKTYEKAELMLFSMAVDQALASAHMKADEIDIMLGGDLLDQIISASFTARSLEIPFVGLYGACSTMAESLIVASMAITAQCAGNALCVTGSHFSSSERQYRFPLELGNQRPPTSQRTVTATGATVLAAMGKGPQVKAFTIGKVIDYGITDANNMGAAMAPAAADTIAAHFTDTGLGADYYDYVVTGDLGKLGKRLAEEMLEQKGIKLGDRYRDCGCDMYYNEQEAECGGSGCGCAASLLNGYYLKQMSYGNIKRILLVATGALLSPTSTMQGESIPGVAHAVAIEME